MPRMKNARHSEISNKKVATLATFGFKSPERLKEKGEVRERRSASITNVPAHKDETTAEHKKSSLHIESEVPVVKKRGRPPKNKAEPSSKLTPEIETVPEGRATRSLRLQAKDPLTLTIKKEQVGQYISAVTAATTKKFESSLQTKHNGHSESPDGRQLHDHRTVAPLLVKGKGKEARVEQSPIPKLNMKEKLKSNSKESLNTSTSQDAGDGIPKLKISGLVTSPERLSAEESSSSNSSKPSSVYVPPPQSRSSRIITPSKRVLEDIVDKSSPSATKKIKLTLGDKDMGTISYDKDSADVSVSSKDAEDMPPPANYIMPSPDIKVKSPPETGKRVRKPSQKILDMMEGNVFTADEKVKSPVTVTRKPAYQIVEQLESLISGTPKPTERSSHDQSGGDNEDSLNAECYACQVTGRKTINLFKRTYCFPCQYAYTSCLRKNMIPPCEDGCSKNNIQSCKGCKAMNMNVTLPVEKQVQLRKNDGRREQLEAMMRSHRKRLSLPEDTIGESLTTVTIPKTPATPKPAIFSQHSLSNTPALASSSPTAATVDKRILSSTSGSQLLSTLKGSTQTKQQSITVSHMPINPSNTSTPTLLKKQLTHRVVGATSIDQLTAAKASATSTIITLPGGQKLSAQQLIANLTSGAGLPKNVRIVMNPSGQSPKKVLPAADPVTSATPLSVKTAASDVATLGDSASHVAPVDSPGPRIKNVSRSVTVVQGEPAVINPADTMLRLSALPAEQKCKLWKEGQSMYKSGRDEEDDGGEWTPSRDDDTPRAKKFKGAKERVLYMPKVGGSGGGGQGKRKKRCGTCIGCTAQNCRKCIYCRDMTKYGGPGKMKQSCADRKCLNKEGPAGPKIAQERALEIYSEYEPEIEHQIQHGARLDRPRPKGRPPKRLELPSEDEEDGDEEENGTHASSDGILVTSQMTNRPLTELIRASKRQIPVKGSQVEVENDPTLMYNEDGTMICEGNPGFSLMESEHRLMADFADVYDIDQVWQQGVAIVSSVPPCVNLLCYLCGSGGKHELIFCAVCCEPFHDFCLEEDKPRPGSDWLCRKCQFCHVCGKLDELLKCDKCQNMYHPVCLSEDYLKQPTEAGIWMCSTCVKCKSCGVTTPGTSPGDMWNEDFTLCAKCETLKQKGNFCPICHLCYSDDDWECKMIQCLKCESWTHAKCENLDNELYELIGILADDDEAQYICPRCDIAPVDPETGYPAWRTALLQARTKGFELILASLLQSKASVPIAKINPAILQDFYSAHPTGGPLLTEESGTSTSTELTPAQPSKSEYSTTAPTSEVFASPTAPVSSTPTAPTSSTPTAPTSSTPTAPISVTVAEIKDTPIVAEPMEVSETTKETGMKRRSSRHSSSQQQDSSADESSQSIRLTRGQQAQKLAEATKAKTEPSVKKRRCTKESSSDTDNQSTPLRRSTRGQTSVKEEPESVIKDKESHQGNKPEQTAPVELRRSKRTTEPESEVTPLTSLSADAEAQNTSSDSAMELCAPDPIDLSVRFKDLEWETPHITYESLTADGAPIDLATIQNSLEKYKSVTSFVDDVVRIIQGALSRSKYQGHRMRNSMMAVKSLFTEEMAALFPFFEVNTSGLWEHNRSLPKRMLYQSVLPPSDEHTYALWLHKGDNSNIPELIQPSPVKQLITGESTLVSVELAPGGALTQVTPVPYSRMSPDQIQLQEDTRKCQLCSHMGDDHPNDAGRLIYCGADDWVHINCAIWSAEVYEEIDGTLQCVSAAVSRGKQLDCRRCGRRGATVGCNAKACTSNFHFTCAKSAGAFFLNDKRVFCCDCSASIDQMDQVLEYDTFAVSRTVTVDFSHTKISKAMWKKGFLPEQLHIQSGSMYVQSLGKVNSHSDYLNLLVPVNYSVMRVYWSTKTPFQRCLYTCRVVEVHAKNPTQPTITIPDITIGHDPSLPSYVPTEELSKRYPDIFREMFGMEVDERMGDIDLDRDDDQVNNDPLSQSWPATTTTTVAPTTGDILAASWPLAKPSLSSLSETTRRLLGHVTNLDMQSKFQSVDGDTELCNLTGFAGALNRAAYKSIKKRRKKARQPAAVLYGSLDGDVNDSVAELMEIATTDMSDEELEEKEVIILKDLDEKVAEKVMDALNSLTQAEVDDRGGIHAVMEEIVNKYSDGSQQPALPVLDSNVDSPAIQKERFIEKVLPEQRSPKVHQMPSIAEESESSSAEKMDTTEPMQDNSQYDPTESGSRFCLRSYESSDDDDDDVFSSEGRSSSTSMKMSSECSSETPPITTMIDENMPSLPTTMKRSPPKIVITDFSSGEPMEIEDPFTGILSPTAPVVSFDTKEKLQSLVRKRSESIGESSQDAISASQKRSRACSLPDIFTGNTAVQQALRQKILKRTISEPASVDPPIRKWEVPTILIHSPPREESSETSTDTSTSAENQSECSGTATAVPVPGTESVDMPPLLGNTDSSVKKSRDQEDDTVMVKPTQTLEKVPEMPVVEKAADSGVDADIEELLSAPRLVKSGKRIISTPMKRHGKRRTHTLKSPDSCDSQFKLWDKTPECSESDEFDSDSDVEERIIVPPTVSCIVKTVPTWQLPNVLNVKVLAKKLPESESDSDSDSGLTSNTPPPALKPVEATPREVSREVRKDMINYCEDTSSSESTSSSSSSDDEQEPPTVNLRRRAQRVDYRENKKSDDEGENSRGPIRPKKVTGRVTLARDGSIKDHSENIPSELQKTISDAIRKARKREEDEEPQQHSTNQSYAGTGRASTYGMADNGSSRARYAGLVAKRHNADAVGSWCENVPSTVVKRTSDLEPSLQVETDLIGDECQLTLLSPSSTHPVLPTATNEEEVVHSTSSGKPKQQANQSSTFLAFEITSEDGFTCKADNWNDAWRLVTEAVRDLRVSLGYPALSFAGVNGLNMYGLDHSNVSYFTEQLYGARYCLSYRFKHHKPPLFDSEEELCENPSGSARSDSFTTRKQPEMFSFIDSRFRRRPALRPEGAQSDSELTLKSSRRATSIDLPMAMRFRHLRSNAKEAVGVYRSGIHGRGLYCKRNIDQGEMVIEYAGEVIRHTLCDKREKYYESKNIGCYMFRIDNQLVVDATMRGNAARFINHSCDPNCYSKVIDVNGEKHIVIFSMRPIRRGEELTYDYKFPFEEVKIPCTCGARRCRGYLN